MCCNTLIKFIPVSSFAFPTRNARDRETSNVFETFED